MNINKLCLLFFLILVINAFSNKRTIETGAVFEIKLTSKLHYFNPVLDVSIECTFKGNKGTSVTIPAFWNGDSTYLVRYSFQDTGTYIYTTSSNRLLDTGINGISDTIKIIPTTSKINAFLTKGRPVVSKDGHYFTYRNGEPFFYLSCTCWEITWKSTLNQVRQYVSDRKKKKFNAFQLSVLSHQFLEYHGVINRNGDSAFINQDFYLPNPKYLAYLDSIVTIMNDSGMVVLMTPLFAPLSEVNHDAMAVKIKYMPKDQTLKWYKYIGSRYAGANVMWMVGGDHFYDEVNGRNEFWSNAARELKKASGPDHLMSIHTIGGQASTNFYDTKTDWLDFNMYSSGHIVNGNDLAWFTPAERFYLNPPKPILNAEACYEDIFDRFWLVGHDVTVDTFRIQPEHVRKAAYESLLAGSLAGMSYGVNGVWQWSTPQIKGSHSASFFVDSAWNLPGSYQMTIFKSIMEKYHWYTFRRRPDLIKSENKSNTAISESDEGLLLYLSKGDTLFRVDTRNFEPFDSLIIIDPLSGIEKKSVKNYDSSGYCIISKPDTIDMVAAIITQDIVTIQPSVFNFKEKPVGHFTITKKINAMSHLMIHIQSDISDNITIELFNAIGQLLYSRKNYPLKPGLSEITIRSGNIKGVIFVRVSGSKGFITL